MDAADTKQLKGYIAEWFRAVRKWLREQPKEMKLALATRARERMVREGLLKYGEQPDKKIWQRWYYVEAIAEMRARGEWEFD